MSPAAETTKGARTWLWHRPLKRRSIQQLDQVIQQNAEELAAQSEQLQKTIGFFKTAQGAATAIAKTASKPAPKKPAAKVHTLTRSGAAPALDLQQSDEAFEAF